MASVSQQLPYTIPASGFVLHGFSGSYLEYGPVSGGARTTVANGPQHIVSEQWTLPDNSGGLYIIQPPYPAENSQFTVLGFTGQFLPFDSTVVYPWANVPYGSAYYGTGRIYGVSGDVTPTPTPAPTPTPTPTPTPVPSASSSDGTANPIAWTGLTPDGVEDMLLVVDQAVNLYGIVVSVAIAAKIWRRLMRA